MTVLVVVLVVTNLATLGVLGYLFVRPPDHPRPDAPVAAALDRAPAPTASSSASRRVISVEILNAIELAGTRGRLAGLAGTLVPGLTKRIVYDQTIKIMRQNLVQEGVVADVRLHSVRPLPPTPRTPPPAAPSSRAASGSAPGSGSGSRPSSSESPRPAADAAPVTRARPAADRTTGPAAGRDAVPGPPEDAGVGAAPDTGPDAIDDPVDPAARSEHHRPSDGRRRSGQSRPGRPARGQRRPRRDARRGHPPLDASAGPGSDLSSEPPDGTDTEGTDGDDRPTTST